MIGVSNQIDLCFHLPFLVPLETCTFLTKFNHMHVFQIKIISFFFLNLISNKKNWFLTRLNHIQVVKSWFFSSLTMKLINMLNYPSSFFFLHLNFAFSHQIHNLLEVQPKSNIDWFRLIEDRSAKKDLMLNLLKISPVVYVVSF